MIPELESLMAEARHRYHTSPPFHARVKLAIRIEDELDPSTRDDREARFHRLERVVTVLHALDQAGASAAAIRYVGPPL